MIKAHLMYIAAIASLSGVLWYAIGQNQQAEARSARQQSELETLTTQLSSARANAEETRRRNERLRQTLRELEQTRERLQGALSQAAAERAQLEAENREYREWANTRLPDSVIRLLNDSALAPGTGGGNLQRSGPPGTAGGTPEPPTRYPQSGPADAD